MDIGFVVNLEMENMLMQQQFPQSDVMYSSHGEDPLVSSVNDSFGSLSLQCAHPEHSSTSLANNFFHRNRMVNEINSVPTISSTNSSNVDLNCFGGSRLDFMFSISPNSSSNHNSNSHNGMKSLVSGDSK